MDSNSLAHLEKLGYEGVLLEMAKGDGLLGREGSELRADIKHWLRLKEQEMAYASAAKRDAREEETLSIARSALINSKQANIIAIIAIICAAAAAIMAAVI